MSVGLPEHRLTKPKAWYRPQNEETLQMEGFF